MTVYSFYKLFGDQLLPDAPEIISDFIKEETDASARRNAFSFLIDCSKDLAIDFLEENSEDV